jgi:hypothetical protein
VGDYFCREQIRHCPGTLTVGNLLKDLLTDWRHWSRREHVFAGVFGFMILLILLAVAGQFIS